MFLASLALLGSVVWVRATNPGAWLSELEGQSLGEIPVMDFAGHESRIVHPATIYFFEADCLPCAPMTRQLNAFVATRPSGGLPVYALTNSINFSADSARVFGVGVQPLRLRKSTRQLRLIQELPLVVRTDALGRIERAYVGEATPEALMMLNYPRAASPAGRN
jgi:hypothetical protein